MEKLTLKEIAGYLPYQLEFQYVDSITQRKRTAFLTSLGVNEIETTYKRKIKGCSGDLISWEGHNNVHEMKLKPLLYPLEILTKTIVHNGVEIIPIEYLGKLFNMNVIEYCNLLENGEMLETIVNQRWCVIQKLHELHFDLYGLLDRGLAIDKSTLNSK